jgi:hypothetical protein
MQLCVSVLAHMLPKSDRELPMDGGRYRLHLAGRFLVSKSFELFARVNNTAARLAGPIGRNSRLIREFLP